VSPAIFTLNELGASVTATVTDTGSGPATPTVSTSVDTSVAGSRTASLTASDNAGNATTVACSYTVVYVFSGYLAPVNNPSTVNTGRAGKRYPVKFQLTDASGMYFSDLVTVSSLTVKNTSCSAFSSSPTDALEISTTQGPGLHYDSTANQFIYNWPSPTTPGCYTLFVNLADGTSYPAFFSLS
jgi:hypothetical protein